MTTRTPLTLVLPLALAAVLLAPQRAEAQFSFTNGAFYDASVLTKKDWSILGRDFTSQSVRGAMALVFADRAPITDAKEIQKYVKAKGLLGVAFPGLTADPVAAWSMAKQLAVVNKNSGKPVLAVNSGWTDFGAGFGHFFELGGLRPAVDAGRAFKHDPISNKVSALVASRRGAKGEGKAAGAPLVLLSHSAGGYYGANVAWTLAGKDPQLARSLRVYNLGIATRLPKGMKAKQLVGTTDTLAQVNSSTAAFHQPGTKIVDKLSHGGGEHWGFADSFGDKRWTLRPLEKLFKDGDRRHSVFRQGTSNKGKLITNLRSAAKSSKTAAQEARNLANKHKGGTGVKKAMWLRLDHEATMLGIQAKRQNTLANLLEARANKNTSALGRARKALVALGKERHAAHKSLQKAVGAVRRDMMQDSTHFMSMMMGETMVSMTPMRSMNKVMEASIMGMKMTQQWTSLMFSNPFVNPFALFASPRKKASTPRVAAPQRAKTPTRVEAPKRAAGPKRVAGPKRR